MARQGIEKNTASASSRKDASGTRGWAARAGAATLVLGLTACSSLPDLPDYANPVEWYNSSTEAVGGWFSDEEPKIEAASKTAKAGEEKAAGEKEKFPTLASVPEKPKPATTSEAREKLKNELSADRANARYTDETPKVVAKAPTAPKRVVKSVTSPAVKPVAAPPAPKAANNQLARLPSAVYQGKRSSLWPNAPAPGPSSEAATTSARVGRPVVSSSGQISSSSATRTSIPQPVAPKPEVMVSDAKPKDTMTAPTATQTAAAPIAPPAPEIPPKFTLTPPSASTGQDSEAASASAGATSPSFQLTPPSGLTGASGNEDAQQMLRFGGFEQGGAAGIVNFGHGSARLSSSDRATLAALAREAMDQGLYVRVVGHASMRTRDMDPFEHTLANFNVSLKRANVVAQALLEMGLPAEQLIVDAVGDTEPLYSEAMPSGEQGNRRAEIYLES